MYYRYQMIRLINFWKAHINFDRTHGPLYDFKSEKLAI